MKLYHTFLNSKWLPLLLVTLFATNVFAAPATFDRAKIEAKQHVYFDRKAVGTFYCGCSWEWAGRSGGRIALETCGYEVRKQPNRAERLEWEHIVPAYNFGRARQCWQDGGRRNCISNDPVFRAMEADLHNLTPSVGEVNGDRSNYNFGVLPSTTYQHGSCPIKIDFSQRTAEPRDEIKGKIARIYFYMHDRYDLRMSRQQQQLLMAWDRQFPVTEWELTKDRRIAERMGHSNPFVTGNRQWSVNHRNSGEGLVSTKQPTAQARRPPSDAQPVTQPGSEIRGNRRSNVYHLPQGCPSYNQMSERNIVSFTSEEDAVAAGFRKAGNCR